MYRSNGLYIRFTSVSRIRKRDFLPPRGPFSSIFLQEFGLFSVCSYGSYPRVLLRVALRSPIRCVLVVFRGCGHGHGPLLALLVVRFVSYRFTLG